MVASFFTRDLQMDWRLGAEHFEEYLLDHDPASNWGNWNYVAGVGSDPREDRYFNVGVSSYAYRGTSLLSRFFFSCCFSLSRKVAFLAKNRSTLQGQILL